MDPSALVFNNEEVTPVIARFVVVACVVVERVEMRSVIVEDAAE